VKNILVIKPSVAVFVLVSSFECRKVVTWIDVFVPVVLGNTLGGLVMGLVG
jgi:formate/nitrite transporter FocA (FNT family)